MLSQNVNDWEVSQKQAPLQRGYLEGEADLVSRLIMGISRDYLGYRGC